MFPAKVCRHICRNKAQLSGVTKTDLTVYFPILLFLLVLFWFLFPPNPYVLLNNQCSNIYIRRAMQKPTLVYATIPDTTAFAVDYIRDIYYISTGIYCCLALVSNQNFARIADSQETMRRVNAFYYVYAAPPRVIPNRASAIRSAPANLAIFLDLEKIQQKEFT